MGDNDFLKIVKLRYHEQICALFLLILSFVACYGWINPLFPKTHEYYASVYTLMDFDNAFRDGNLLVNWLPTFAKGGQPVFEFYSPLSYYFSELFVLIGLSFTNAIKATIISSFFLSGLTMFVFIRRVTDSNSASLISAMTYIFFPYHLVDSNLRGDLAETFSFVFLPIVLYFLFDSIHKDDYIRPVIYAGISYAFLILSHIIIGYIFSLFTIIYLVLNLKSDLKSIKKLISITIIFGCVSLGLSCFYWLPALLEGYVFSMPALRLAFVGYLTLFAPMLPVSS